MLILKTICCMLMAKFGSDCWCHLNSHPSCTETELPPLAAVHTTTYPSRAPSIPSTPNTTTGINTTADSTLHSNQVSSFTKPRFGGDISEETLKIFSPTINNNEEPTTLTPSTKPNVNFTLSDKSKEIILNQIKNFITRGTRDANYLVKLGIKDMLRDMTRDLPLKNVKFYNRYNKVKLPQDDKNEEKMLGLKVVNDSVFTLLNSFNYQTNWTELAEPNQCLTISKNDSLNKIFTTIHGEFKTGKTKNFEADSVVIENQSNSKFVILIPRNKSTITELLNSSDSHVSAIMKQDLNASKIRLNLPRIKIEFLAGTSAASKCTYSIDISSNSCNDSVIRKFKNTPVFTVNQPFILSVIFNGAILGSTLIDDDHTVL